MEVKEFPPGWALMVLDMQNDIICPPPEGQLSLTTKDNPRALDGCIMEVRRLIKLQGWDLVVFTRTKHPEEDKCSEGHNPSCLQRHISFDNSYYHVDEERADWCRRRDGIENLEIEQDALSRQVCSYNMRGSGITIRQNLYPPYCVMGTRGSDVIDDLLDLAPPYLHGGDNRWPPLAKSYLRHTRGERVTQFLPRGAPRNRTVFFDKGLDRYIDAYSAIFRKDMEQVTNLNPRNKQKVTLTEILHMNGIRNVVVAGVGGADRTGVQVTCSNLLLVDFKVHVVQSAAYPFQPESDEYPGCKIHHDVKSLAGDIWAPLTAAPARSQPDSVSAAARQLYANIAFRLNIDDDAIIKLLIKRAGLAHQWLKLATQAKSELQTQVARVVDDGTSHPQPSASLGPTGLAVTKQCVVAISDLSMPLAGSMGLNLALHFPAGTDPQSCPYGPQRINVFDAEPGTAPKTQEFLINAQKLLQAKTAFVARNALAMLDLVLINMKQYQVDKPDPDPAYSLAPAACEDFYTVYNGLSAVHKQALARWSKRKEATQQEVLRGLGWDWQLFFQTFVNSRQRKDDGENGPRFSVCPPRAQCFLYPTAPSAFLGKAEFEHAYERVVARISTFFEKKSYGSSDASQPKAFVDALACLHYINKRCGMG